MREHMIPNLSLEVSAPVADSRPRRLFNGDENILT